MTFENIVNPTDDDQSFPRPMIRDITCLTENILQHKLHVGGIVVGNYDSFSVEDLSVPVTYVSRDTYYKACLIYINVSLHPLGGHVAESY